MPCPFFRRLFRFGLVASMAVSFAMALSHSRVMAADKPNVVIVITDDQGYGDLSCTGNPVLKTPQIDQLYADSVRLADYHVAPTCSPTRSAFLTGHWTNRTGVWHTIMGRSMLRANEVTMGDVFQAGGYQTGMFGKWHLGDNHPYRPEDRGFGEVLRHGGGGVGQTPDFWNNAYFGGHYWHNSTPTAVTGFCTDVFFDYAKQFIQKSAEADQPFLAYIATNAPHGPMHSPPEYSKPYADQGVSLANFYGMIANIDDNVGKLRRHLDELRIADNTIFIFTTDNGTSAGDKVFNAGMRGKKGSQYDGGHRVPFFVHWPQGKLGGGRDVEPITAYVDVLPTLIDMCGIAPPKDVVFDGTSIVPLLNSTATDWPDRMLVTDSQRVKDPIKWRQSAVMTSQYRLIDGKQLFDIKADPGQTTDVADSHPEVVKRLHDFYEAWWTELEPSFANSTAIDLGHPADNPARLTSHDWITTRMTPWNQGQVRAAMNGDANTGFWNVNVVEDGDYEIRLRRWPLEADAAIDQSLPPGESVPGVSPYRAKAGKGIDAVKAKLQIADQSLDAAVSKNDAEVVFETQLRSGRTRMSATFETADGEVYGAYYAYVLKK
ncbi:Arylsulfatase precursor [Rubripirellula lacrimiformis]|uniref:Arylsulfatase n=1 Tax=Rubripirellula lacrimiformis TaxID=1930273 RepID=A0A517NBK2_9BACT|nr:arylsulfatase [Rubripirellula lacrimiformis]QDT04507.1 Arylsulfatase precursor [Rubripirellula lacrimiformis]